MRKTNIIWQAMRHIGTLCALVFCLAISPLPSAARAASDVPDPVRFGLAVEQGNLNDVMEWLDGGLDPDYMADRIGTGLMVAAWEGNIAMMDLFIAHGAHINLSNRHDEQALQLAAWRGHLDAVKWLLDRGAALNRPGQHWSALHYAAFANHQEIAQLLIERGAEVNARTPNGSTGLMMAAREGHTQVARQMLEAGADPQVVNDSGESALTWAMRHEHLSLAQMISSPSEFAQAAKAAPTSFGASIRSQPAPPEIEEILLQMRLAQAEGRPTDALRKELLTAVERFKQGSRKLAIDRAGAAKSTRRGKPSALMITARRGQAASAGGAERAELVYQGKPQALANSAEAAATAPAMHAQELSDKDEVADILAQLRRAQAAGQPTDGLRQALFEAVARFKRKP